VARAAPSAAPGPTAWTPFTVTGDLVAEEADGGIEPAGTCRCAVLVPVRHRPGGHLCRQRPTRGFGVMDSAMPAVASERVIGLHACGQSQPAVHRTGVGVNRADRRSGGRAVPQQRPQRWRGPRRQVSPGQPAGPDDHDGSAGLRGGSRGEAPVDIEIREPITKPASTTATAAAASRWRRVTGATVRGALQCPLAPPVARTTSPGTGTRHRRCAEW
jgi:hypothetical protein